MAASHVCEIQHDSEILATIVSRVTAAYDQLDISQANIDLVRGQLQDAWATLSLVQDRHRDTNERYQQVLRPDMLRFRELPSRSQIERLRLLAEHDFARVRSLTETVDHLEQRYRVLEALNRYNEAEFLRAAQAHIHAIEAATSPPAVKTQDALDLLLAQYQDAAGDVKLCGERLVELVNEHQQTLASRERFREQERELSVSDSEVDRAFEKDRHNLDMRLNLAIHKADRLRQGCREAGLDPDCTGRFVDVDQASGSLSVGDTGQEDTHSESQRYDTEKLSSVEVSASKSHSLRVELEELCRLLPAMTVNAAVVSWVEQMASMSDSELSTYSRPDREGHPRAILIGLGVETPEQPITATGKQRYASTRRASTVNRRRSDSALLLSELKPPNLLRAFAADVRTPSHSSD